jgi:SAM-dependent methyltransferase
VRLPFHSLLRHIPFLVRAKRRLWAYFDSVGAAIQRELDRRRETTTLDVVAALPLYAPNSSGGYAAKAELTLMAAREVFPALASVSGSREAGPIELTDVRSVALSSRAVAAAEALKERLDAHGSDKATYHNYHYLYGTLLADNASIQRIFEIGLGTGDPAIVSNMGPAARPGASLRAFRDFCPNAVVYGADIDARVLFQEERIKTCFVDQTSSPSLQQLCDKLPADFDLVIDDGLHSPHANIEALKFGLRIVRAGGWVVIEDICPDAEPVWQVVAALLPPRYRSHLYSCDNGLLFAVVRLD